ncbi:hypothetical protein [Kitasatospora sp. NPDC057015]|uniref:hypothetical protein n=1 Tax=Kitasatospora sp. NPDC057015 TaxID=3346001 RepID=UPI003641A2C2
MSVEGYDQEQGEPTPVADPPRSAGQALARGVARLGGEFLLEAVGALVLCALTTASLAALFLGTQWVYRHHPVATLTGGATMGAVLVYGCWLGFRPGQPRRAYQRVAAGAAAATGLWLLACLGYAEFGQAFG